MTEQQPKTKTDVKPEFKIRKTKCLGYPISERHNLLTPQLTEEQILSLAQKVPQENWKISSDILDRCVNLEGYLSNAGRINIGIPQNKYLGFGPQVQKVDVYSARFTFLYEPGNITDFDYFFKGITYGKNLRDFYESIVPLALRRKKAKEKAEEEAKNKADKKTKISTLKKLENIIGKKEELSEKDILHLAQAVKPDNWNTFWNHIEGRIERTDIHIRVEDPRKKYILFGPTSQKVEVGLLYSGMMWPTLFKENIADTKLQDFYHQTHQSTEKSKKNYQAEMLSDSFEKIQKATNDN